MNERDVGEPALALSGRCVWVHKRQFPDSTDHWGGNWLNVTVRVRDLRAQVWAAGAILTTMDLATWRDGCSKLHRGETDSATLDPAEPELTVVIRKTDSVDHLELRINITPDHLRQEHIFHVQVDQSDLPCLTRELDAILAAFPAR